MRIFVLTSCTGEKKIQDERALTCEDFQKGEEHIRLRESELRDLMIPAEELYTGQQHIRLMEGVKTFRQRHTAAGWGLDLWILSAGYGLIPGSQKIAPYECTFQGMKKDLLRKLADTRRIPQNVRNLLSQPYDLGLILLGDAYLRACSLDQAGFITGQTFIADGGMTRKMIYVE